MQKTKSFIQYKGDSFLIRFKVGIKGNICQKNVLDLYGEYHKELNKKWRENNKKWIEDNKEYKAECAKKYYEENKDKILKQNNKYLKTTAGKIVLKRKNYKRRELGFNPLNNPFENCEGHHIDKTNVIFIPKEIHRSVSHNIWTGKNMHEINTLAIDYYWEERFKKYGVIK